MNYPHRQKRNKKIDQMEDPLLLCVPYKGGCGLVANKDSFPNDINPDGTLDDRVHCSDCGEDHMSILTQSSFEGLTAGLSDRERDEIRTRMFT